jgi:hypothetical protein
VVDIQTKENRAKYIGFIYRVLSDINKIASGVQEP